MDPLIYLAKMLFSCGNIIPDVSHLPFDLNQRSTFLKSIKKKIKWKDEFLLMTLLI